jgi:tetratricopeptide (TPR) repeat protein
MKLLFTLLLCGCVLQGASQSQMTAKDWQDDLNFLKHTVHKDYPFLFKKTTAREFDDAVDALHSSIPNMQDHQIVVGLSKLVSSFKYGHTQLGFRSLPNPFHQLPMNLYQFKDGVYIQGVHRDYEQALGAEVIAIAGMPIDAVLKAIYPVVPVENDQFFKAYGFRYIISPEILHAQGVIKELSDTVNFTLDKNGQTFKMAFTALENGSYVPLNYGFVKQDEQWLDARLQDETPLYLKNLDKIYFFEYLADQKTIYVRHSQIQDDSSEDTPQFYSRVFDFIDQNDVERLVLDVRLNGGGNNYKNKAVITKILESKKINKTGNLIVIIGRRTFSAAQNLVNELDNYTDAIFVGEPTGENINFYGDTKQLTLPNSRIPVYLSFAWWQDKPQWENAEWKAPHIAVDMTFEEYKTDSEFILDPMQYMTDLYLAGEMEKLGSETHRMINDPAYQFFDFEKELNKAGYRLLSGERYEQGIAVFSFVTQMFPASANAWDSLAEGYLKAGQHDKAKEYYNKAITLDEEDGPTARNARKMLEKLDQKEQE